MKQIGLVGFNSENFKSLKQKYKNLKLVRLENLNTKNLHNLSALIAFDFEKINKFLISRSFAKLKNLKWVHVPIAGVDKYTHLFNDMKFTLTCGKKINDKNVAEHCIALIFFLTRQLKSAWNKSGNRTKVRPIEVNQKKALIIGYGGIGKKISILLNAMGTETDAIRLHPNRRKTKFINKFFQLKNLESIVSQYDLIIISIALTNLTKGIINKKVFSNLCKNVILVNVSRAEVVNEYDFAIFLKSKKYYGVGVDVLKNDKLKNIFINSKNKNLIYSNHTAGLTDNYSRRLAIIDKNISRFALGKVLLNKVDFIEGY